MARNHRHNDCRQLSELMLLAYKETAKVGGGGGVQTFHTNKKT